MGPIMARLGELTNEGGKDGMAVAKAFVIFSIPFVLAEAVTGIMSHIAGVLSIPPTIGVGTAVDLAILVGGLSLSACWMLRKRPQESGEGKSSRETMK